MPTLEQIVRAQRAALTLGVESPLFHLLGALYQSVLPGLIDEALRLATPGPGEETLTQAVARQRAQTLALSVEAELARLTPAEVAATRSAQLEAIRQGSTVTPDVLRGLLPPGAVIEARVTVPAVERMAAALLPGSPVDALFAALPRVSGGQARAVLLQGVTLGRNPRRIARDLRQVMGGTLAHAETIARTEVMRVYRGAAQEAERVNADVVDGWVWISARTMRTCGMCWAMHGTRHHTDSEMATHPSCRCSRGPMPRGAPPFITRGEVLFEGLPERDQRRILGPGRYDLYQSGAVGLPDMVGKRNDPQWGPVRYQRSVRSLRRTAARRA